MADTFSGVVTSDGKKRVFLTDDTLTKVGVPADSKAVGDKFKEVKAETSSLKEDISNKITKFYATNNGENHLADSDNGKIADMMVYGKSEQKQYSGRNLMPNFDDFETTVSGVSIKAKNGIITLKGNSIASIAYSIPLKETITLPDKNIYIHLRNNVELSNSSLAFKNENGQVDFASISSTNRVLLASPLTGQPISEIMLSLDEGIAFKSFKMQPSLELTDEATSYEPYTGGQPSPSPDYPQEIKSVVNPTVKVVGKNLLNATLQTITQNGVTCTNNGDGTYTLNGTATSGADFFIIGGYNNLFKIALNPEKEYICKGTQDAKIEIHMGTANDMVLSANGDGIQIKNRSGIAFVIYRVRSGSIINNVTVYPQLEEGSASTDFEPYHEQTITLPYTLNAIPVSSGGNVTIDGQQYIADYVDIEKGKLIRNIDNVTFNGAEGENWVLWNENNDAVWSFMYQFGVKAFSSTYNYYAKSNTFTYDSDESVDNRFWLCELSNNPSIQIRYRTVGKDVSAFKTWLAKNPVVVQYVLATPTETDLTPEEIQTFKALTTYYPVTNISVNSEQLDGLTVFNYPISLANGWNYVRQQLNDNRDYIYDMDTKTQDIDTQAAEAYVNSEYAVALTELEV